jgi:peptidoglycan-associated lipoprotein
MTLGLVACGSSATTTGPRTRGQIQPEGDRAPVRPDSAEGDGAGRLLTAYFDYDDSGLRADAKGALRQNAEVLRTRGSSRVELQGNCDERGTDEYNLALGKRRAESARQYLRDLGIPDNRMTTVSFGEENPAVQGGNESAWAKNRRVDFVLR